MSRTAPLWMIVVRWIAMLPAAVGTAWLGSILIVLVNQWTMASYVDPDSFLARVFIEFASNAALGGLAVYVACAIAPSYKGRVAAAMTALVLLFAAITVYAGISDPNYWLVFAGLCLSLSACTIGYGIFSGELPTTVARTDLSEGALE